MQGIPIIRLKRLKRTALVAGAGALVAGASFLGASQAHALTVVGTQLGAVSFTPSTGAATATGITYATTTACPSTNQGSGVIRIIDPSTGSFANLAPVSNSVASPFSGTFNGTFSLAESLFPDIVGAQAEVAVYCFTGTSATGTSIPVQYTFVNISADGSTYTETNTVAAGPAATTTTLVASPSPAQVNQTVTLTATVAAQSGSATPAGTVQFEVGGTAINSPVTLNASGVATTTTTFAAAGTEALSAVFTPTDTTAFSGSTSSTFNLSVTSAVVETGTIPLAVTVPATGAFTLTVDTADTVTLTVTSAGTNATAATTPIVVSDTRNTYPGWSVTGQDSSGFTGSGSAAGASMSGNQLGWTPTNTGTLPPGTTLGAPVSPASPGLGSNPATLASAVSGLGNGFGTSTLGANLNLLFPVPQAAGPYTGGLTITGVGSAP